MSGLFNRTLRNVKLDLQISFFAFTGDFLLTYSTKDKKINDTYPSNEPKNKATYWTNLFSNSKSKQTIKNEPTSDLTNKNAYIKSFK